MPPRSRVTKLPTTVAMNLDTFEREESFEPFVIVLDGHEVTMTDPSELDWKVLMTIARPSQFFKHVVSAEDKEIFRKADLPGWKMKALLQRYQEHYGLDAEGNDSDSPI